MNYGDTIRMLRKRTRHSQASLAEAMGVSQSAIASYESNVRTPSLDMIKRFAAFFDVPMSTFMPDYESGSDDLHIIVDSLHQNPDLRLLFDKTRLMTKSDIKAVLSVVDAITKERERE